MRSRQIIDNWRYQKTYKDMLKIQIVDYIIPSVIVLHFMVDIGYFDVFA